MSQENNNTITRKYQHICYTQRKVIEILLRKGFGQSQVAKELCLSASSISREVTRGWKTETRVVKERPMKRNYYHGKETTVEISYYSADVAQRKSDENSRRSVKHFKTFSEDGYAEFVEELILSNPKLYSLDTANHLAKEKGYKGVSTRTLYNWVALGLLRVKNLDLLLKCRRKVKKKVKVQKRFYGESIDNRPKEANNREEIGHFEGDSIIGKDHKGQIITFVDRKARKSYVFKFKRKEAKNVVKALLKLKKRNGENFTKIFKSITFDNGSEFAYSKSMERLGVKIYYAHAYCSWERGSNENFNGLIRRFFPKGTDFNKVREKDLQQVNRMINNLPRKILGWKTATEVFDQELEKIGFIA